MAGFWADSSIEPKRAYRWLLNIGGQVEWIVKKVTKPKVTISESSLKFLNHTFWYPGRAEWDTVSVTLVDPVDPNSAAWAKGLLDKSGYKDPSTYSNAVSTISKRKSVKNALQNMVITQLGSEAKSAQNSNPIETWTLKNAWVKDIAWGELDYESEDMVNIELTIRYDYAVYEPGPGIAGPDLAIEQANGQSSGMGGIGDIADAVAEGAAAVADAVDAIENAAGELGFG